MEPYTNEKKKLIVGTTGSGKTTYLMKEYVRLVNQGVNTNHILVLVRNRGEGMRWRNGLCFPCSSKLRIMSYFGFIQGEIKKCWPLIQKKIPGLKIHRLEPVMMTIEMAQFFMGRIIEDYRRKGKLLEVHAANDRIAVELIHNLSKAAMTGREFDTIGELLYNSHNHQEIIRPVLYRELQEICNLYIEQCLNWGFVDYALGIALYHKILIQEENYQDYLFSQLRHIIVDDIEEGVYSEIQMVSQWLDKLDSAVIAFNSDGEMTRALGACPEFVEEMIFPKCKICYLDVCHTAPKDVREFGETLISYIEGKRIPISGKNLKIDVLEKDLRSEMIKAVGEKIISLIDQGAHPEDIAIVSPVVDKVMEYCLGNMLEKRGINLCSLVREKRWIDQSYIKALVTLACIAHPHWNLYPSPEDITTTLSMILGMDKIRSNLITLEIIKQRPLELPDFSKNSSIVKERIGVYYMNRYKLLRNWIVNYRKGEKLLLNDFFQKLFNEILMMLPDTEQHLQMCRQLIDATRCFIMGIADYLEENEEADRFYIDMLKRGMKAAENIIEIEEKIQTKKVLLATPYMYLAYKHQRKIQIWTDVISPDWFPGDVKELTNPHVFSPKWDKHKKWTEADAEKYKLKKGNTYIRRLMNRCGKNIIFAQSLYGRSGYEQEGPMGIALGEIYQEKEREGLYS